MSEVGDAISRGGDAMQRVGCGLILTVTLPIFGFALFGLVGAAVGLVIGLAFVGSAVSDKQS
jgi:hypothetical protein